MLGTTLLNVVLFGFVCVHAQSPTCDDIDSQACVSMEIQNPGLCQDPTLSSSVCARHCKLCPARCYHCDGAVTGVDHCTQTKQCAAGELCMKLEVRSSADSHAEYAYKCANKTMCDGRNLMSMFGRRSTSARDISIHCCPDDLCNDHRATTHAQTVVPVTTHAPITARHTTSQPHTGNCQASDLFVIMYASARASGQGFYWQQQFMRDIVAKLSIGTFDTLVSMVTFGTQSNVVTEWELDRYPDVSNLTQAISNLYTGHHTYSTATAVDYLVHHVLNNPHNRQGVADKVLIITRSTFIQTYHHHDLLHGNSATEDYRLLHNDAKDVIVVTIEDHADTTGARSVATDNAHYFNVDNGHNLMDIVAGVSALICK